MFQTEDSFVTWKYLVDRSNDMITSEQLTKNCMIPLFLVPKVQFFWKNQFKNISFQILSTFETPNKKKKKFQPNEKVFNSHTQINNNIKK